MEMVTIGATATTMQHTFYEKSLPILDNRLEESKVSANGSIPSQQSLTHEKLEKIVLKLNTYVQALNTKVAFHFNDTIDSLEVNVVEMKSGQLIRKVPSDEVVRLAEYYQRIYGIIFDKTI